MSEQGVPVSQRRADVFTAAVIVLGGAACIFSLVRGTADQFDARFMLLAALTLLVASRITVPIPFTKGQITASDTFIFLILLMCGGEAATLVAAVEGGYASRRYIKSARTLLFNASMLAVSTCATAWTLRVLFGDPKAVLRAPLSARDVAVVAAMAFTHYLVNSVIAATRNALRSGQPVWGTWGRLYLWTSITYFAGAAAAAIIGKVIIHLGLPALVLTAPIVLIIFFTYTTYRKNIETSADKAAALEQFRSAFDHSSIGMALVAPDGQFLEVNTALCSILGYGEGELLSLKVQSITADSGLGDFLTAFRQILDGRVPAQQLEQVYRHKNGHAVWVLLNLSLIRRGEAKPPHLIFQVQDITDRKRAEERLLHDAFHDALTGLPNRALFVDHLKLAIDRGRRGPGRKFAVLFLDLDRFKMINDSLGHHAGDELLVAIARRLEACLRPGDTVARLGGDEFTILLEDISGSREAVEVAERIKQKIAQPFDLNGREVFTSVSIGIAPSTLGYERPEEILRDADTAMYSAKSSGKMQHKVFVATMHSSALSLLQLDTDLRRALEREEFVLHYQPIINLADKSLAGFEALIRWQHPERGLLPPMTFIPLAEETGLIVPIGQWVLREAGRRLRNWQRLAPRQPPLTVSVNVSGRHFTRPELVTQISEILRTNQLDARSLKLELTESVVMENIQIADEVLRTLRAIGVELSIDDFGTGYSSLSYLHRFPVNTLKIDRTFVSQMERNNENTEIAKTIITLAHSLGLSVVAEGVENAGQLSRLVELGCQFGQGFFFAKPIVAEDVPEYIAGMCQTFAAVPVEGQEVELAANEAGGGGFVM